MFYSIFLSSCLDITKPLFFKGSKPYVFWILLVNIGVLISAIQIVHQWPDLCGAVQVTSVIFAVVIGADGDGDFNGLVQEKIKGKPHIPWENLWLSHTSWENVWKNRIFHGKTYGFLFRLSLKIKSLMIVWCFLGGKVRQVCNFSGQMMSNQWIPGYRVFSQPPWILI